MTLLLFASTSIPPVRSHKLFKQGVFYCVCDQMDPRDEQCDEEKGRADDIANACSN